MYEIGVQRLSSCLQKLTQQTMKDDFPSPDLTGNAGALILNIYF